MSVDWLEILRDEVKKAGSIKAVADKIGYKRPSVSLALAGKYTAGTDKIRAKVIATFCDRIICPHTRQDMAQSDCEWHRTAPLPSSDPDQLKHWAACQTCPNNPGADLTRTAKSERAKTEFSKVQESNHA